MRRWVILIAAGAALSGCKNLDKDRSSRDRNPADPASRTKPADGGKGWLDGPGPGLGKVGTPPADSWTDPTAPGYDVSREVRGVLAGFVQDPDGRKVRDVFIEVEPADGTAAGAPVGVQTDRQGYFLIKGLKPKQAYQLTARTKDADGHSMAGRVYAQTSTDRSQFIIISLLDGLSFPGGTAPSGPGRDLPGPAPASPAPADRSPPGAAIPPPVLPSGGTVTRPDPILRGGEGTGLPLPGDLPPDGSRSNPPAASRPDLMTDGPDGLKRPPAANIPGPAADPPRTVTPPPPLSGDPGRSQSRFVKPGARFVLVDAMDVQREFPSGRAGELVLLDFMTTACLPCKKAIPEVKGLQARYGLRGVEVVGVACDEATPPQRRALAAAYQRSERLNYLLYTEPGTDPTRLARRFGVQAYPTLVLLGDTGEVLWKGHPNDAADLERVIADELAKR